MDAFFFWLFSLQMIVCGLGVVLNRNPVAGALCFAAAIVGMAGLFVLLSAFFLAAVQILVTAGAVMVLFLFIIMLLDVQSTEFIRRQKVWMGCAAALALFFVYLVALTLRETPQGRVTIDSLPSANRAQSADDSKAGDDTHQIGRLLFTTYVAPFEVTSLLILVATIGVIVLCKQEEPERGDAGGEIHPETPPIKPEF